MSRRLDACAAAATPLTPALAHEIIAAVANEDTLHTVLFRPERRSMTIWLPWRSDQPLQIDVQRWLTPAADTAASQPARSPVTRPAAADGPRAGRAAPVAQ